MKELDDDNLAESLKIGNYLLMFYASWCPLCPPVIEILSKLEMDECGKIQFARINYDSAPKSVWQFGVPGVPAVLAIKDGKFLHGWGGAFDADSYREIVEKLLENTI
jgi:thioredoxin-like negative regulator of GroEL